MLTKASKEGNSLVLLKKNEVCIVYTLSYFLKSTRRKQANDINRDLYTRPAVPKKLILNNGFML